MGYKYKPNKGMKKRFRVTKSGKVKFSHEMNSHRRSARTSKKKRHLGRPAILPEGHAKRLRYLMGVHKLKPAKVAHEAALAQAAQKASA